METSAALFELASVTLACRDQDTLLKTVAARVGAAARARAVLPDVDRRLSECKLPLTLCVAIDFQLGRIGFVELEQAGLSARLGIGLRFQRRILDLAQDDG